MGGVSFQSSMGGVSVWVYQIITKFCNTETKLAPPMYTKSKQKIPTTTLTLCSYCCLSLKFLVEKTLGETYILKNIANYAMD